MNEPSGEGPSFGTAYLINRYFRSELAPLDKVNFSYGEPEQERLLIQHDAGVLVGERINPFVIARRLMELEVISLEQSPRFDKAIDERRIALGKIIRKPSIVKMIGYLSKELSDNNLMLENELDVNFRQDIEHANTGLQLLIDRLGGYDGFDT